MVSVWPVPRSAISAASETARPSAAQSRTSAARVSRLGQSLAGSRLLIGDAAMPCWRLFPNRLAPGVASATSPWSRPVSALYQPESAQAVMRGAACAFLCLSRTSGLNVGVFAVSTPCAAVPHFAGTPGNAVSGEAGPPATLAVVAGLPAQGICTFPQGATPGGKPSGRSARPGHARPFREGLTRQAGICYPDS